jgi:hypothetical protein
MVHALKEIHRALLPNGVLIDLRPLSNNWPLEVIVDGQASLAGPVNDSFGLPDDEAANSAIARAARERWFIREREGTFGFLWYWDSLAEIESSFASDPSWVGYVSLPAETAARAQALSASARHEARVRLRLRMHIARWRKR